MRPVISLSKALDARPIPGLEKPGAPSRRGGIRCFPSGGQGQERGQRIVHFSTPSPFWAT